MWTLSFLLNSTEKSEVKTKPYMILIGWLITNPVWAGKEFHEVKSDDEIFGESTSTPLPTEPSEAKPKVNSRQILDRIKTSVETAAKNAAGTDDPQVNELIKNAKMRLKKLQDELDDDGREPKLNAVVRAVFESDEPITSYTVDPRTNTMTLAGRDDKEFKRLPLSRENIPLVTKVLGTKQNNSVTSAQDAFLKTTAFTGLTPLPALLREEAVRRNQKDDAIKELTEVVDNTPRAAPGRGTRNAATADGLQNELITHARSDLGVAPSAISDLSQNVLYAGAPNEIKGLVHTNLQELVKNDLKKKPASDGLFNLMNLTGNDQFQEYAARTLGEEKMRRVNLGVAAATLAADINSDDAELDAIKKFVEQENNIALKTPTVGGPSKLITLAESSSVPYSAPFKQFMPINAFAPNTNSKLVNSVYGAIPGAISNLLTPLKNFNGAAIPAESSEWIDMARFLATNPSELKWATQTKVPASNAAPQSSLFVKGLNTLEKLIVTLRDLKALDLLALIKMPQPQVKKEPELFKRLPKGPVTAPRIELALNPNDALKQSSRLMRQILIKVAKLSSDQSIHSKNVRLLKAHAKAHLAFLLKSSTPESDIQIATAAMRKVAIRKLWLHYDPTSYLDLRRSVAISNFALTALELKKAGPFAYMLQSTAQYMYERNEISSQRALQERAKVDPDRATASSGLEPDAKGTAAPEAQENNDF